ncbi:MAG: hypothetical protein ACRD1X_04860 [Vicinamibacteria bacterium]
MSIRSWLRDNGYGDIVELIDEIQAEWRVHRKKTRRNWWEVLAGDKAGRPRVIEGRRFPVLRAAQIHQGMAVTKNAIQRNVEERPLPVRVSDRWADTATNLTRKGFRRRTESCPSVRPTQRRRRSH